MKYTVISAVEEIVEVVHLLGRAVQKHLHHLHSHMHFDSLRRNRLEIHRHLRLHPLPHFHSTHHPRRRAHQTCYTEVKHMSEILELDVDRRRRHSRMQCPAFHRL